MRFTLGSYTIPTVFRNSPFSQNTLAWQVFFHLFCPVLILHKRIHCYGLTLVTCSNAVNRVNVFHSLNWISLFCIHCFCFTVDTHGEESHLFSTTCCCTTKPRLKQVCIERTLASPPPAEIPHFILLISLFHTNTHRHTHPHPTY